MIKILLSCAITLIHVSAFAHGYILNSRAKLCALGVNTGCGPVMYEPQSVEGPDRFPATGPADGTIAAAGDPKWAALNVQTPTRWKKINMQPGTNTFKWHFTATHVTRDWRYFITKENWDPNQPLTRAAFTLTPFCTYSGNSQHPATDLSHVCNVPKRSGYHVILSVWDIGDTNSSFYHLIDAKFPGTANPPPVLPPKQGGHLLMAPLLLLLKDN